MVVSHFLKWIGTARVSERVAAAAALARAYVDRELAFEDRCAAEAALTLLLDDASAKVRQAMAEALSMSRHAPVQIVAALASDQPEVARFVLARSPLLTDADLIDRVATGQKATQSLIAGRPVVSMAVAAAIAIAVVVVAIVLWQGSDFRATADDTAPSSQAPPTPASPTVLPATLTQRWAISTDPQYGAVASPYGTVVTADRHTVTGHDARTGKAVWSYSRSNVDLCAIGSGDTKTDDLDTWTGVHGIMTLYAKNGWCSQVTLLNPNTGARLYQRTSPNQVGGQLFFGVPYVGWMGQDYLELWRHDLVATIRYGNQPNPVNSDGPHLGCTFTDAAVTNLQLATIEHCSGGSTTAQLVLNWPTPDDAPDKGTQGWDANHSKPKATIDTHSAAAVIVGITSDRVAVLVSEPSPALVIYDASGAEISRTPVDVSASEITATASSGITPSVVYGAHRYTLVGRHLLSMSAETVTVAAPTSTATSAPPTGSPATSTSGTSAVPQTTTEQSPVLDWIAPDAIGLPALIGGQLLVPSRQGLTARNVTGGSVARTIAVQRGGWTGRVDVTAIGSMIVEVRGGTVVGLSAG